MSRGATGMSKSVLGGGPKLKTNANAVNASSIEESWISRATFCNMSKQSLSKLKRLRWNMNLSGCSATAVTVCIINFLYKTLLVAIGLFTSKTVKLLKIMSTETNWSTIMIWSSVALRVCCLLKWCLFSSLNPRKALI